LQAKQAVAVTVAAVALLGAGFWAGIVSASGKDPGSAADPLVSKSYVDEVAANLQQSLQSQLTRFAEKTYVDERLKEAAQNQSQGVDRDYVDSRLAFQVVELTAGQQIIGYAGTELVLRAGEAIAITSPQGGVLDATAGTDLAQGYPIPKNHLLVIPRSDRRGLVATKPSVLMVKGNYEIVAAGQ